MKTVILAGGLGTRLSEETAARPKPMVEIGGYPMLCHIMDRYVRFGFDRFVVALGYRGDVIKRYFRDLVELDGDLAIELRAAAFPRPAAAILASEAGDTRAAVRVRQATFEPTGDRAGGRTLRLNGSVHLVDTGLDVMTGGRLRRLAPLLRDETFMLTYGDGVADIDLRALVDLHRRSGRLATITAVRPPARFGGLLLDGSTVTQFVEKPQVGEGWINGGFMVFEPAVLERISSDHSSLETDVLEELAAEGQLSAYCHTGFWQCMDTLRDVRTLESLWAAGNPPWRTGGAR